MRNPLFATTIVSLVAFAGCGGGGGGGGGVTPPPPAPTTTVNVATFQRASVILGQANEQTGVANGGFGVGAGAHPWGYGTPRRVAGVDGGVLYVTDTTFSRILGYDTVPAADGAPGDFVLGQALLYGSSSGTDDDKFSAPNHAYVGGGRLFLADFGNDRVLIWNTLPLDDVPADVVVGQADFVSSGGGTAADRLTEPTAVAATDTRLLVADGGSARILVWSSIPTTNGVAAVGVLGQPDFATTTPGTTAAKLNINPRGLWTDGTRIVVADTGNNRVLIWSTFPMVSGTPADIVLGQPDFMSNAVLPVSARDMNGPEGVFVTDTQLFVADTGNNRVLVFEPFPAASYAAASKVLGQAGFASDTENDDDQNGIPSAAIITDRVMSGPTDVTAIGNRLFVTDGGNGRVLVFEGQ